MNLTDELSGIDPHALPATLLDATTPVVVRGLVGDWPAVQAARAGDILAYLRQHDAGTTVDALIGPPEIEGRFFYNERVDGFNFARERLPFAAMLQALERWRGAARPPALYVGSTTVDVCLPHWRAANRLGFGELDPLVSIWLGNRTRIAAHQDLPANLACVVAGRRRFTLYPPDALPDLYVGPLELTPAGQPISLVDPTRPDLERFPRYAAAAARAHTAELGPGDAVLIPSLWWHHVQALDEVNVLVNAWWRRVPAWMDGPIDALLHTLLSVRDLPDAERRVWRAMFDHYVFGARAEDVEHIPPAARGVLAPLDAEAARRLRARLLHRLNR